MSVIPLIPSGIGNDGHQVPTQKWTVARNQEEFSQTHGVEGHAILISPLDEYQLIAGRTNTSYDLRVGPEYRDHRDAGASELLVGGGEITLLPRAAVIIRTEEHVHLPRGMFGYIVPKVSLLQKGVSNTVSKVDPGYNGELLVTVFNLGKQKVTMKRLDPFCSISVHQIVDKETATLFNGPGKRIVGRVGYRWWRQFLDELEHYHVPVLLGLIAVEAIRLIVEIVGPLLHFSHTTR